MISAADIARLPVGVVALTLFMLWPAIWAAVTMTAALSRDVIRQEKSSR